MKKNKKNENYENERVAFANNFKRISNNNEENYQNNQNYQNYNEYSNVPQYNPTFQNNFAEQSQQENLQFDNQQNNLQQDTQNSSDYIENYPNENNQYLNQEPYPNNYPNGYSNQYPQQSYNNYEMEYPNSQNNYMQNNNNPMLNENQMEQQTIPNNYSPQFSIQEQPMTNIQQNKKEIEESESYPSHMKPQDFQYSNTNNSFINNNLQGEIPEYEASAVFHRKNNIEERKRNHKYPSMKTRFKAGLIDFLFFLVISIVISTNYLVPAIQKTYSYFEKIGGKTWFDLAWEIKGKIIGSLIIIFLINLIFSAIIPFLFKGQTIGKKICKIKIVSNNIEENDIPNFIQLFKREVLGKMLSFLGLGIPFIIFNHDELKRALPDKLANTHIEFA